MSAPNKTRGPRPGVVVPAAKPQSGEPRALAFYLRVSTVSQDYPSQLHALQEYCRRHGWKLPPAARVFSEKVTGKIARRTQLDQLLQACRDGHVDTILVYKIDRLGNSLQHLVNLQAEFDALKIRIVGVSDGVDTLSGSAAANYYRNGLATAAQFNREIISERTRAGLDAARARGRNPGRPRKKEKQIAQALKLHAQHGYGARELHRRTGLSLGYLSDLITGKRSAAAKPKGKKK